MYKVSVAPIVSEILIQYTERFAADNGIDCASRFIDNFDKAIESLKELLHRGVKKISMVF